MNTDRKRARVRFLMKRDGDICVYCKKTLTDEDRTLEHKRPRALGGTNHISNLALACFRCNTYLGGFFTTKQGLWRLEYLDIELGSRVVGNLNAENNPRLVIRKTVLKKRFNDKRMRTALWAKKLVAKNL